MFSSFVLGVHPVRGFKAKLLIRALLATITDTKRTPTIFSHDAGSDYTSNAFRAFLKKHGIADQVSRLGPYHTAVCEAAVGTLKR